jgi:hypothetical protein
MMHGAAPSMARTHPKLGRRAIPILVSVDGAIHPLTYVLVRCLREYGLLVEAHSLDKAPAALDDRFAIVLGGSTRPSDVLALGRFIDGQRDQLARSATALFLVRPFEDADAIQEIDDCVAAWGWRPDLACTFTDAPQIAPRVIKRGSRPELATEVGRFAEAIATGLMRWSGLLRSR